MTHDNTERSHNNSNSNSQFIHFQHQEDTSGKKFNGIYCHQLE